MKHFATASFWELYEKLPKTVQQLANKNFELLKENEHHPSLQLKRVGRRFWSVRVGLRYRALGIENEEGLIWVWIGTHADYDKTINK